MEVKKKKIINNTKSHGDKILLQHVRRFSIVVSIPACHAGNPGSIPGNGAKFNTTQIT